jgi:hypothetical protein
MYVLKKIKNLTFCHINRISLFCHPTLFLFISQIVRHSATHDRPPRNKFLHILLTFVAKGNRAKIISHFFAKCILLKENGNPRWMVSIAVADTA